MLKKMFWYHEGAELRKVLLYLNQIITESFHIRSILSYWSSYPAIVEHFKNPREKFLLEASERQENLIHIEFWGPRYTVTKYFFK